MAKNQDNLIPLGTVTYRVYSPDGELVDERKKPNKIVDGMLSNIVESFIATTENPCSGFRFIGLGSGDTPVTINDTELDDEFEIGDFGGSEYAVRLNSYTNANYSTKTYTVSASIKNESDDNLNVAESGLFNSDTPGDSGTSSQMGSRTVLGTAITMEPDTKLEITWNWSVNSG